MDRKLPTGSENSIVMMVHDRNIDRRVLDEARTLIKKGWNVIVVAADLNGNSPDQDQINYPEVEIIRPNLNTVPEDVPYSARFQDAAKISWRYILWCHFHFYAEAIKHPAAVYVAHDLPQLLAAVMAADYYQSYVVYDAHELYPDQEHFIKDGRYPFFLEMDHWLAPLADATITVNRSIAEIMKIRYQIPLPNVILNSPALPPNVNLPLPNRNLLRKELGIPEDKFILLYQGGLGVNRNLDNLIRAMALVKNKNAVLAMMGPGLDEENDLTAIADELRLRNQRVFFRGAANQTELLSYTSSADAGVIPYKYNELNTYYCTPNKLFEFIVAGLPILANDLPELNRFVGQQGIGLNKQLGSPEEIACAIDEFLENDVQSFRKRSQELSPGFVWETQGLKISKIYKDLFTNLPKAGNERSIQIPQELINKLNHFIDPESDNVNVKINDLPTDPVYLANMVLRTIGTEAILNRLSRKTILKHLVTRTINKYKTPK